MTRPSRVQLAILLAASSLTIMAGAFVSPALPAIRAHFANVPNVSLLASLVLTLPGLVIAVLSPCIGLVADRFGRARLLVVGLALFVASGVSGSFVDSLHSILLGRVLVGAAVACVMTTASALLVDHTEGADRQAVIGLQAAVTGLGSLIFTLLAGVLTQYGWRIAFLAYLLPIILVPLAYYNVKDVFRPSFAPAASLVDFPFGLGLITYSLAFFGMTVLYAIPLQIPYLLSDIGAPSPVTIGFAIGIASFSAASCALFFGKLRMRFSPISLVAISYSAVTAGYLVIAQSSSVTTTTIGVVLAGAGFGINLPNLTSWLLSSVSFGLRGRAAGGLTSAISLGQFISTFVYHAIASEYAPASSFLFAAASCAFVVVAAVLSLALRKATGARRSQEP